MSYLSAQAKAAIIDDPSQVETIYNSIWHQFALDLQGADPGGSSVSNDLLASAFAAVCAWSMKPYGANPAGIDLASILAAQTVNCVDYVRLALYFMDLMPQCNNVIKAACGWNGGAVGNHAQLFVRNATDSMLLDPTVGLVVHGATYDGITTGTPFPASVQRSFFLQFGGDPAVRAFSAQVITAITNGGYKPSDALYYCGSLNFLNSMPNEGQWPTPQAVPYQVA